MKIYRARFYLGDQFLTETFYAESEYDQARWESEKANVREHPHALMRLEITTFEQVGGVEVIKPEHPQPLDEYLGE